MPGSAVGQGTKGLGKTEKESRLHGVYLLFGGRGRAEIKCLKHTVLTQIIAKDKIK